MTTNDFTLLMLVCVPVAACLIVVLFRFEKRLGRARPRSGLLLFPLLFGVLYLFYLDGAMQSVDLPRFRGGVRSWDQGIWSEVVVSSS
jgi:hypothetical protein